MNLPETRNFSPKSDSDIHLNALRKLADVVSAPNADVIAELGPIMADIVSTHNKAMNTIGDMGYVLMECANQGNASATKYLKEFLKGYSFPPSEWDDFPSSSVKLRENSEVVPHAQTHNASPKDSTTPGEAIGYKIGKLIPVFGFSIASTMIARFVSPYSWTSVFVALLSAGYLFVFLRDRLNGKLASERKAA